MIAELKVYGNPSSLEPTKTYTVYRLTPYTVGLIQDFMFKKFDIKELVKNDEDFKEVAHEKISSLSEKEQGEEITRFLRILFPEITEEEIWMLDYGDGTGNDGQFFEFVNIINNYANNESNRSLKN